MGVDRGLGELALYRVMSLILPLRSERGTQPKIPMFLEVLPGMRELFPVTNLATPFF